MYYSLESVLFLIFIIPSDLLKADVEGIKKLAVDIGKNVTIKCPLLNLKNHQDNIMWLRDGGKSAQMSTFSNGTLFLKDVDKTNAGLYSCTTENGDLTGRVNITVRTPPPALILSIKPSTVLVLLIWEVNGTGGYPIMYFTAQYRLAYSNNSWIPITPLKIMPSSRQLELYSLKPNTTYEFRMWATNQLGKSPIITVFAATRREYLESELARHLLKGSENFDTRWWAAAVGIVLGTLILLGCGTCILLYQECKQSNNNNYSTENDEPEIIELLPNIILNPGFEEHNRCDYLSPDENSNNETVTRLNNNTVVKPIMQQHSS